MLASSKTIVGWLIGILTAVAGAIRAVVSLINTIRGLMQRLRKLEKEVDELRTEKTRLEGRVKHLELHLETATGDLMSTVAENVELNRQLMALKLVCNEQANLATLRGELLRMHGIDPGGINKKASHAMDSGNIAVSDDRLDADLGIHRADSDTDG